MSVLAQSVGNLWRVIESYDLDPQEFFEAEGLSITWPIEPGTRVPYTQLDAVRADAAAASGDPAFGLRTAECVHPSHLGALGYAVLASETLRSSFERIHRYVRVLNDQGYFKIEDRDGLVTTTVGVTVDSRNAPIRDDTQMAVLVALCRMNAGPGFQPESVSLKRPKPSDTAPWDELFRCPIAFGAENNQMTVTKSAADKTLPSSNTVLAEMNERIVAQRLARLDRDNIPDQVRAIIMDQLPSGEISDESVAESLHMTPRTMHRRLKEDGESFRTLLKSVRQDLARQYVADDSLTLTEITFLLGFSEMSSFSRAFKNWYGTSPSEARQPD